MNIPTAIELVLSKYPNKDFHKKEIHRLVCTHTGIDFELESVRRSLDLIEEDPVKAKKSLVRRTGTSTYRYTPPEISLDQFFDDSPLANVSDKELLKELKRRLKK
jgi:hypothetical protein